MSCDCKKPGVAFRTTVTFVIVLLYVVSFGPACWLSSRSGFGRQELTTIYRPILMLMNIDDSPSDLIPRLTPTAPSDHGRWVTLYFYPSGIVSRYANCLAAEHWEWRFRQVFEYQPTRIVRDTDGDWEWCDAAKS